MPRTQTRSRVSPKNGKPPKREELSPEVLELFSDPDTPLRSQDTHQKHNAVLRPKKTSESKLRKSALDVIEISSDEDDVPPSQDSLVVHLRNQVKKLRQERDRHFNNYTSKLQELGRCQAELKEANARASENKATTGKLVLDPSELDDGLSCEICTLRMYSPWLLTGCGHTFCLSCLRDWFGTTHARFLQSNPRWNQSTMRECVTRIEALLQPHYLSHPQLSLHLQQLQQPTPEYTCPTCRKQVYRRPVEVYAIKSLNRTISAANESEKRSIPSGQPLVERRNGRLVVVDPWDGYFPKER